MLAKDVDQCRMNQQKVGYIAIEFVNILRSVQNDGTSIYLHPGSLEASFPVSRWRFQQIRAKAHTSSEEPCKNCCSLKNKSSKEEDSLKGLR